ncbi:MAG: rhomboid family intramembrane serine protease [Chloroflexi bacterium]|nr:rhomboid family intramembrane serine protease [Chloroflexota bacterium]
MLPSNEPRRLQPSLIEKILASPTPVTWILLVVNLMVWAGLELSGGSTSVPNLLRWGAKFGPAIADGEYWRLFTPMFLHIGFAHLLTNSLGLIIFGRLVERYFGSLNFLLIYLLAGVFGNIASYAALSNGVGAGASGAVFGIIGAYGSFLFRNRSTTGSMAQSTLGGLGIIVGINLIFGFSVSGIDNWAHIGGLVGGFLIAYGIVPRAVSMPIEVMEEFAGNIYRPVLIRVPALAVIEVLAVSVITIVATTWVIGTAYPIR